MSNSTLPDDGAYCWGFSQYYDYKITAPLLVTTVVLVKPTYQGPLLEKSYLSDSQCPIVGDLMRCDKVFPFFNQIWFKFANHCLHADIHIVDDALFKVIHPTMNFGEITSCTGMLHKRHFHHI